MQMAKKKHKKMILLSILSTEIFWKVKTMNRAKNGGIKIYISEVGNPTVP